MENSSGNNAKPDPSLDLDGHILNSCAGLNGHNRWFDKSITISVESNSRATMLGEHSPCDALIPSIVADYMLAGGIGEPKATQKHKNSEKTTKLAKGANENGGVQVQRLTWVGDQQVLQSVEKAEKTIQALVEDSEGLMLWYDEYGADWIKKSGESAQYLEAFCLVLNANSNV